MADYFYIKQKPNNANLIIYPNADISSSLVSYGANPQYNCINEAWSSPNEDTDYLSHASDSVVSAWFGCTNHTTEAGTINYVRLISRAKSHLVRQAGTGSFYLLVNDTVDKAKSSNLAPLNINYKKYYYKFSTKPSGGAWTWNDIDNMKIGLQISSPSVSKSYSEVMRPNSLIADNSVATYGALTLYDCVNESIADEDTTYIRNNGMSDPWDVLYATLGMSNITGSPYNITAINVSVHHRAKDSGSDAYRQTRVSLIVNGNQDDGEVKDINGSWKTYGETFANNPDGDVTWSVGSINQIQLKPSFRFGSGNTGRITQIYATANYTIYDNPIIRATQLYAVVNYSPAVSTVSLSMPDQLSVSHNRNVSRFNFPDGDYEIADMGRTGKALNLSGIEYNSTVSDMQSLKDMCHYGSVVSITDLPDTNLNTEYLIRGFTWDDMSYSDASQDRVYRWNLQLEEA